MRGGGRILGVCGGNGSGACVSMCSSMSLLLIPPPFPPPLPAGRWD